MPIRLKFKQFLGIHSSSVSESRIFSATNTPSSRASRSAPAVVSAMARVPSPSCEPTPQTAETSNIESTPLAMGNVETPSSSSLPTPPTPSVLSIPAEPIPDQRTTEVTTSVLVAGPPFAPVADKADEVSPIVLIADRADEVIAANTSKMTADEENERRGEILQVYYTSLQLKDTAQIISSNINVKLNEDPWFMHALDDVAKLHPFVSVAVLAFKAVYSLEMTRRQNDKRIIALYGEMKNMIEVLTRLKDIQDPETIGPNGRTIEARMQSLVAGAAQDIKDCANACDTWMKKRILLKVLVGPAWEGKLAAFSATFNSRRMEFEFALQIHTASGIDQVQAATTAMNEKLSELTQHFVDAFSQLRPPEEAQLIHKIEREYKGGIVAVRNDEANLRELYDAEGAGGEQDVDSSKHQRSNARAAQKAEYGFKDFKLELQEDVDVSVKNNFKVFEGKFQLFYVRLENNLHKYMREEGDRVIEEVTKGPHNMVKDAELKTIWRDMRWKRHVDTKLFVVTLRDYLIDKEETGSAQKAQSPPLSEDTKAAVNTEADDDVEGVSSDSNESDSPGPSVDASATTEAKAEDTESWARLCTDVMYLQPVIDAIDEDAPGYVTIAEVNRFTDQLPTNLSSWSGWQTFASLYCWEILQTFARMSAMRDRILPANRDSAESYLSSVWTVSAELTKALYPPVAKLPDYAVQKFKEYARHEEDRLRKNLVAIKYDIDALETVYAIIGPGTVEKYVLTVMCLMLRKDMALFDLATKVELHDEELWDAGDSLQWVFDTVNYRHHHLVEQFRGQKLNVDTEFASKSCGFFCYYHDPPSLWDLSKLASVYEYKPTASPLPSAQLPEGIPPNNYPNQTKWPYNCEVYGKEPETVTETDKTAPGHIKEFIGQWSGFKHNDDGYALESMLSFFAHAAPVGANHHIEARGQHNDTTFTLTATVTQHEQSINVQITIRYDNDLGDTLWDGVLQPDRCIAGSQGSARFLWKKVPEELMILRPLPPYRIPNRTKDMSTPSKARALFHYAVRSIISQNRQKAWSWSYFRQRRDDRHCYMEVRLMDAVNTSGKTPLDAATRHKALHAITGTDKDFYGSIWARTWRLIPGQS